MTNRAIFLDRDGTINEDCGYPNRFSQIKIFPSSFEALRKINEAGFLAVIITNQSGVGRGYLTEEDLRTIHDKLRAAFAARGVRVDGIYYCPHYNLSAFPQYRQECVCRKPGPALALQAAADLDIDLGGSYMIGDKAEDVEFGLAIGATPVLVLTGNGPDVRRRIGEKGLRPAAVAANLLDAVDWILARERGQPR